MNMDYYDLVNENDVVVGKVPVDGIHDTDLIHRVVAVYVFANDGRLYVQEHRKSGGLFDHSVGGHVDFGEHYDVAAVREAQEELGITDPIIKISTFYSDERFSGAKLRHYFGLYECHPSSDWNFKPNTEVKKIFPMNVGEIVDLMNKEPTRFTAGFINTIREYIRAKNLPHKLYTPEKISFTNSQDNNLTGVLHNPSGNINVPIVLFIHGHSSSKYTKNFVKLTETLWKRGVASLRIDLYGHGESEGKFEECTVSEAVDDVLRAVDFLKNRGYDKIGLIGSSFGGIASIVAASKINSLSFLILKSPVSNYEEKYALVNGREFIDNWRSSGMREYDKAKGLRLKYSFYEDAVKNDGYVSAKKISAPTLIVHGNRDELVPVEQSIKLAKLIPNSRLEIIKDAGHSYTIPAHRDKLLNLVSEFVFNKFMAGV